MSEQHSEQGKYAFVFMWFFVTNRDTRPEESESAELLEFVFDHRIQPDDIIIVNENEIKAIMSKIGKENGSGVYV
jgi:hypothetical protein